jgi:putative transposase
MPFNPNIRHRHSIRLKDYDYSQAGAYFITICTLQRECLFGDITDGEMRLNELGKVVLDCWSAMVEHFSNVQLDEFIVMPNHFHGILQIIESVGAKQEVSASPNFGNNYN